MVLWKKAIHRLWIVASFQSDEWTNRAGRALAVSDPALSTNFDLKDGLCCALIFDDSDIAVFEPRSFVRTKPRIRHEQYVVVQLFALPAPTLS